MQIYEILTAPIYLFRYLICWPKTFISREWRRLRQQGDSWEEFGWRHCSVPKQRNCRWPCTPWNSRREPDRVGSPRGARFKSWALNRSRHYGGDDGDCRTRWLRRPTGLHVTVTLITELHWERFVSVYYTDKFHHWTRVLFKYIWEGAITARWLIAHVRNIDLLLDLTFRSTVMFTYCIAQYNTGENLIHSTLQFAL